MNSKNLKRMLCWILAVTMVLGLFPATVLATESTGFQDVTERDWFKEAVDFVTAESLMNGVGNNKFDPNGQTTRAMVVTVLYRMEDEPAIIGTGFSDTGKNRWYSKAVIWAKENGIVNGYTDNTFRPDVTMTREELVTVFYRYSQYKGYDVSQTTSLYDYTDYKTVQKYAKTAMKWAVAVGLVTGFADSTLRPQGESTRAQLATILMRYNENIKNRTYAVSFDTNGGSAVETQYVRNMDSAVEPEAPTKENHRFIAWYLEPEFVVEYDFTQPVNKDLVLYAAWKEVGPQVSGDSGTSVDVYAITNFVISEDEETAVAVVSAPENCVLAVRFMDEEVYFSEDYPNNKEYISEEYLYAGHVVRGGTDMEEVIGEIVGELPEYYVAEAILIDGNGNALCNPVSYIENTTRYEAFEEKTVNDFEDETVLKFSEEIDNNFGVLAVDVKTVNISDLTVDEETRVHTLIGLNETLQPGDKLFINDGTDQALIRIATISQNGDETVIIPATADDEVFGYELSDFYSYIKVDMEYDGELNKEDDTEKAPTRLEVVDVNKTKEVSIKVNPIRFETDHFKVSGDVTGTLKATIVLKWDLKVFAKDYMRCDFSYTASIKPSISVTAKLGPEEEKEEVEKREFKLGKISIPFGVTGLSTFADFKFEVDWALSAGLTASGTVEVTQGFKYNTKDGYQKIEKKKSNWSINCEGHAEIQFGPAPGIGVQFLEGVISIGLDVFLGAKAEANVTIPVFQGGDTKHACYICIDGNLKAVIEASVKLNYKITDKFKGTAFDISLVHYEKELFKFFLSLHNDSESSFKGKIKGGKGDCTNTSYKTTFKVVDENDNLLDANVSVASKSDASITHSVQSGEAVYLYEGQFVATATVDGVSVSKSFTVSDLAQTVVLTKDSGDGTISGVIKNAKDNSGIEGAKITVYKQDLVCGEAVTDSNGAYKITLPEGSYRYVITAENFISVEGYVDIADFEEKYMEATLMALDDEDTIMGGIYGTITDSRTGRSLSGVKIQAYFGANNNTGNNAATDIPWYTNSNGEFSYKKWSVFGADFGLPAGTYTLVLSKEDYITTTYNVTIEGGENIEFKGSISPVSAQHEYRVVLTWGASPSDLDSHYIGVTNSGYVDHIYYSNKNGTSANLDVDDVSSYGPETVYVTGYDKLYDGFYYSVHDYTNSGYSGSYALSNSGATVRLYQGDELLKTFYVPSGKEGTVWNVFSITGNGRITSINTMENISYPSDVGREFVSSADLREDYTEAVSSFSDVKPSEVVAR